MKIFNFDSQESVTFDDVSILPQYSRIESREDPDTSTCIMAGDKKVTVNIPIISANMDCITGPDMLEKMRSLGAAGILHRFYSEDRRLKAIEKISHLNPIISIGIGQEEIDFAKKIQDEFGIYNLCIDVAHGHHKNVEIVLEKLSDKFQIMAGNVCTREGARFLIDYGAKAVKVGVGPGANCSTRTVTGHGVPQLTAIYECSIECERKNIPLIADGGITCSGDIVKAIGIGANAVMIGKLFAGTDEAESLEYDENHKIYWGQSSKDFQQFHGKYRPTIAAEGVKTLVPKTGSVSKIVAELHGGIRSGFSYSGSHNMSDFQQKCTFIKVSHSGYKEGLPKI